MNAGLLALLALAASLALTAVVRKYALAGKLLDAPNERSSHTVPTPRGGGLAIVLAFGGALAVLCASGGVASPPAVALAGAGGAVAVIGFLDDHGHIAARWRLAAHFAAAAWALAWLGGLPEIALLGHSLKLGPAGFVLGALFLVWALNLYNFMDGIDGIASIEAITVSLGGATLWSLATGSPHALVPVLLAAASVGFLAWNMPPARIFMGDVGSGFLGVVLGIFAVWSAHEDGRLFWGWVILLGAFVVDATVTLFRRTLRGERFYEAHRSHAYQYASRRHGSHGIVSLAFGVVNAFWLLPIAAAAVLGLVDGFVAAAIAYVPLVWLAFKYKAGARELQG